MLFLVILTNLIKVKPNVYIDIHSIVDKLNIEKWIKESIKMTCRN